jgi:hypothetical protein
LQIGALLADLIKAPFPVHPRFSPIYRAIIAAGLIAAGILAAPSAPILIGSLLAGLLALILWRHRLVAFFLIWISPFLLVGALLVCFLLYTALVPAFSASFRIPGNDATVRLEFFRINDLFSDGLQASGRYVTFISPHGRVEYNMPGWDWIHRARTSVYLTEAKNIAILGPDGEDILVDADQLKISRAFRVSSEDWTYLGAFDFVQPIIGGYVRSLRFIPATEQEECVPQNSSNEGAVRAAARQSRCATLQFKD